MCMFSLFGGRARVCTHTYALCAQSVSLSSFQELQRASGGSVGGQVGAGEGLQRLND